MLTFSVVKEEFYILSKIREILLTGPIIDTGLGEEFVPASNIGSGGLFRHSTVGGGGVALI